MAYVSLYRRYRPRTFADVVGQDHVVRTLVNAIDEDRLHHAYLFTGPRGTGKTSTARILAKAVNCEQGPSSAPCGTCAQCEAIGDGSSIDVIELDMASHGGVDDARELRDRALFAPATARRKVYILDEVHMASTAAFNALLKLIEEPPGHVLFAMATTDPQKVLPTILSRVQRLDLRRVAATDVAEHVRRICAEEGFQIDEGAVEAVVRAGDGSVRDTLSVLEQVLAFAGASVTTEAVTAVLGGTPGERVFDTVERIAARDLAGLFGLVQGLMDDGHDLRRFTLDLVQHLRDLLVLEVAPDRPDLVDATAERRQRLGAQAGALGRATLLRAVDLLAETVAEQRQGSPRLPLELTLAKLAVPSADGDLAEIADRIARLERTGAAGAPVTPSTPRPTTRPVVDDGTVSAADTVEVEGTTPTADDPAPAPTADHPAPAPTPVEPAPAPTPVEPAPAPTAVEPAPASAPAGPAPMDNDGPVSLDTGPADPSADDDADPLTTVTAHWDGVLESVRQSSKRSHAIFEPSVPVSASRGILTLRYARRYASFHAANARRSEFADTLRAALERSCGLRLAIDVVIEGEDERRRPMPPAVTPADARTPVLEEDDVREAELNGSDEQVDVDALVVSELDARLLDHRPAPDDER